MWTSYQTANAEHGGIFKDLHPKLTKELQLALFRPLIENVDLFRLISNDLDESCEDDNEEVRDECMIQLISMLQSRIVIPGEYCMRENEPGDDLFIIVKGTATVWKRDADNNYDESDALHFDPGRYITTLRSGDVFGEQAALSGEPRNASVRAKNFCDMLVLSKENFEQVLQFYPHFAASVKQNFENKKAALKAAKCQDNMKLFRDKAKQTLKMVGAAGALVKKRAALAAAAAAVPQSPTKQTESAQSQPEAPSKRLTQTVRAVCAANPDSKAAPKKAPVAESKVAPKTAVDAAAKRLWMRASHQAVPPPLSLSDVVSQARLANKLAEETDSSPIENKKQLHFTDGQPETHIQPGSAEMANTS